MGLLQRAVSSGRGIKTVTEIEIAKYLQKKLKEDLINYSAPRERREYIRIMPAALTKAIKAFSENFHPRFMTISAVDHGIDMELLYHFDVDGNVVTIQTTFPKEMNEIDTITDLMPAAQFIEREINDLFGVKFRNHPKPERLILPRDWPPENHPLRKPHEGVIPTSARLPVETLISTGCLATMSSYVKRKRQKAGLPPAPTAVCADEKWMPEFQKIMKQTNFDKKAGYDWKKKKLRYR